MKYTFGIMSNKFELESDDDIIAKVTMCIFFKSSAPIAIYSPTSEAISPVEILGKNKEYSASHAEELKECLASIKKPYDKKNDIDNIMENQGKFGKLKFVGKVRGEFVCAECNKNCPIGSSCYDQSDHTGPGFFPEKIRMCEDCGKIKIANGTEVKVKPVKAGKPKSPKTKESKKIDTKEEVKEIEEIIIDPKNGCGKDTIYMKPDKSRFWRCGEEAPFIGIMHCKDCGGLE